MLEKKEIAFIIAASIILAFAISLVKSLKIFLYTLAGIFFVVVINILAKEIISFYLDSEIEVKLWEIKKYGFKANKYFKKPFPAGIIFPLITTALTFGNLVWMAPLVFNVKPKIYKSAKRHGLYTFSEITEYHLGLIAAAGIFVNLSFAIIGYLIGFSNFAKFNIFYALFNMIPISDLDGNKIFFGSIVIWSFLSALILVGLGYVLFII